MNVNKFHIYMRVLSLLKLSLQTHYPWICILVFNIYLQLLYNAVCGSVCMKKLLCSIWRAQQTSLTCIVFWQTFARSNVDWEINTYDDPVMMSLPTWQVLRLKIGFRGVSAAIPAPTLVRNSYINRRGHASIQLQAACTSEMMFMNVTTTCLETLPTHSPHLSSHRTDTMGTYLRGKLNSLYPTPFHILGF